MALWQQIGNTRTENGPIRPTTPKHEIAADLRFRRIPTMPNHRPLALRRREHEFESRQGRQTKRLVSALFWDRCRQWTTPIALGTWRRGKWLTWPS